MKADFDIGNLFYILLMIVFILAGAFGKKKKPQQVSRQTRPTIPESPEDLLEKKLKEFFGERVQTSETGTSTISSPEEDHYEEKLDVPSSENVFDGLESTVIPEQTKEYHSDSIELQEGILDSVGSEEGESALLIYEEGSIIDEIKLSEGKDLVPADYNEEMGELLESFDARKGLIYSEIFHRREY